MCEKKVLCLVDQYPNVREIFERMTKAFDAASAEGKELDRQKGAILVRISKESEEIWTDLRAILKEEDLLPADYSEKDHTLHMDRDLRLVAMSKTEEDGGDSNKKAKLAFIKMMEALAES